MYTRYCLDMLHKNVHQDQLAVVNGWINKAVDSRFHVYKNLGHYGVMHHLLIPYLQYCNYHYLNLWIELSHLVKLLNIRKIGMFE